MYSSGGGVSGAAELTLLRSMELIVRVVCWLTVKWILVGCSLLSEWSGVECAGGRGSEAEEWTLVDWS